jgi:hypothetical protein
MTFAEIEAEIAKLTPDELRRLALKSWTVYKEREPGGNECDEEDPQLLAALDEAIAKADALPKGGSSADEVRARLSQWTSK